MYTLRSNKYTSMKAPDYVSASWKKCSIGFYFLIICWVSSLCQWRSLWRYCYKKNWVNVMIFVGNTLLFNSLSLPLQKHLNRVVSTGFTHLVRRWFAGLLVTGRVCREVGTVCGGSGGRLRVPPELWVKLIQLTDCDIALESAAGNKG